MEHPAKNLSVEERVERAVGALMTLMRHGYPACVSWSAGKDSSTLLNLVLTAGIRLKTLGESVPPIVVTHADTMIENPEMTLYARNEMVMVREFARSHGLNVKIEVAQPNLTSQWSVRVIGGRALPPFPGTNRDCTMDWKISPMKRLRKAVLKQLGEQVGDKEPVVLIGTRYDESQVREQNMRERGESDVEVRRGVDENGKPSHLFLSPIAWWSADDVWEYLGMVRSGTIPGYSDFEDTFRVYADAMGTSCVIVAEDMSKAMKSSKACGARHGCSLCTVASTDQSMENMLATDERYSYMRGLNQLRNFLAATRWDMARRSWLGRTIDDGYVRIGPDAYSPAMMEELLRYALTIDIREQEASRALGIRPRFQLVNIEQLFAIDAMWSLQAFHKPYHALHIYKEVCDGARWDVPQVVAAPQPKTMPDRYLWVGSDWEDVPGKYSGLNSVLHQMVAHDSAGCMGTKTLADGREVMDVNTGEMMEVDVETAMFVLDELPRYLERHANPNAHPTEAYFHYLQLGMLTIKNGLQGEVDKILRRSDFKVRNNLWGVIDNQELLARSVSKEEAGQLQDAPTLRSRGADGSLSVGHLSLVADPPAAAAPASLAVEGEEVQADLFGEPGPAYSQERMRA